MLKTVEMEEQERDDLAEALNSIYLNEFRYKKLLF